VAVTNVELLLYVFLGLWAATWDRRPQPWTAIHWAGLGWTVALALSAALATDNREAAAKFALRQIGGVVLFFAAADAVSVPSRAAVLARAYAAGAVASGLSGVAEAASPAVAEALSRFKTHPSLVEGVLRASGTLQYANLAAMSWGMALPVTIALWAAGRSRPSRLLPAAGALVLAAALVLSASRAGLLTAALVLGAAVLVGRGPLSPLRVPALAALLALLGFAGWDLATRGGLALRLREREDRSWFEAEVRVEAPPVVVAGADATVTLRARNAGRLAWRASGEHGVALGYLWLTEPGERVRVAATLPRDVAPGETVALEGRVRGPRSPGRHRLLWVIAGDGLAWVRAESGEADGLEVEVRSAPGPLAPEVEAGEPFLLQRQPTRPALWRAGLALWSERPIFGVGPDNFRRLYARKLGPHALDERVHANSLYVEVLATLGLFGAFGLASLGAGTGIAGGRALASLDAGLCPRAAGALGGLAAFFVHGLVDYGLEATNVYGAFWLLAALLAGMSRMARPD
jgi:hypothetical protein